MAYTRSELTSNTGQHCLLGTMLRKPPKLGNGSPFAGGHTRGMWASSVESPIGGGLHFFSSPGCHFHSNRNKNANVVHQVPQHYLTPTLSNNAITLTMIPTLPPYRFQLQLINSTEFYMNMDWYGKTTITTPSLGACLQLQVIPYSL